MVNDYPPYGFILMIGYHPEIYEQFVHIVEEEPELRLIKIGYPSRDEIDFLHELGLTSRNVYIVNEEKDMDTLREHARAIYE